MSNTAIEAAARAFLDAVRLGKPSSHKEYVRIAIEAYERINRSEIARLKAERAELIDALRPFATSAPSQWQDDATVEITAGQCKRARAVLEKMGVEI